jgi:hypothetical protein
MLDILCQQITTALKGKSGIANLGHEVCLIPVSSIESLGSPLSSRSVFVFANGMNEPS